MTNAMHSFFGLKSAPFSISPDPNAVYWSDQHRNALGELAQGIQERTALMLFSGEVGTGKTTIIRHLMSHAAKDVRFGQILNPLVSHEELMGMICHEFGCQDSHQNAFNALQRFLRECAATEIKPVLVIDEAQHLSFECLEQLRLITNIESDQHKLITIILVGQPELREVVQQQRLRQLTQRIGARPHLASLSKDETARYIQLRIELASAQGSPGEVFSRGVKYFIYNLTQGTPRKINALCAEALKVAFGESSTSVKKKHILAAVPKSLEFSDTQKKRPVWRYTSVAIVLVIGCAIAAVSMYTTLINKEETVDSQAFTEERLTTPLGEMPMGREPDHSAALVESAWDTLEPLYRADESVRRAVGSIDYAAHVYDAEQSFAFINGERKTLGSFIGGAQIQAFYEEGIVIMVGGKRYKMSALESL